MSFCNLTENNEVPNVNGRMLDVVLIRENANAHVVAVNATQSIVEKIDNHHPPLSIDIEIQSSRCSDRIEPSNIDNVKDWNFKKCDFNLLFDSISELSWHELYKCDDVNRSVQGFYSAMYQVFDACIPKKRRGGAMGSRYPVWFTKEIIDDVKLKRKLHRSWKRRGSEGAYELFSNLRAELKVRVSSAYNMYVAAIEQNIKANPREFWSHVSSMRSKGGFEPTISHKGSMLSGVEASEAFAEFFSSVFLSELPKLDAESISNRDLSDTGNYVNIFEISPCDVDAAIQNLKLGSSVGPDSIPPWLLKQCKKFLTLPLCHIFNLALKSGIYPPEWKLSRVTPIPKSSDKLSVEEYRPIAILPTVAKVFERVIHRKLYKQMEPFLCDEQHGFRKKRSVNTNLLTIVDFISSELDRGGQVDVLYFDFRKAFDRVNNDILLEKLSALGFAPGLLRFIADYLRDRQQFVRHGLYESQPYHTRSGVSQGSIMGPLLFILMIDDLPAVVKYAKCIMYADDLKLFTKINTIEDCLKLQQDIDAIHQWSVTNKMEFNVSKCCVMTFGRMRRPIEFQYKLDQCIISRSTSVKDLGVTFDRKLTFNVHIATVAKESYQRLGFILRNSREFRNMDVVKLIFSALVRSKLEASACVWHPHENSYTLLLERVQKAFLRYLYKRMYGFYPYMYPTNFLLGTLGYNSLEVRRSYDQLVMMCKILRGNVDAPDLHSLLCRFYVPDRYLRCRNHKLFAIPKWRTVSHAKSPILRSLASLNSILDGKKECDIFADDWKEILSECLKFCEATCCRASSIQ